MDGLLIDSEPLWQEAELIVFNKVGVPLTLEMTPQTMGLRTDEIVEYWYKRYPWKTPSQQEVSKQIDAAVIKLIRDRGVAKAGVNEAVAICESSGLPIAIASSSPILLIDTVLEKLGIANKIKVVHSAHDEAFGKPHPAVYISTAEELHIHPNHCLAFEDSANGVLAAKAAKMKCIAIPEPEMRNDKRFGIADIILHSLNDFTPEMLKGW
jgi:beta-phosphoglucomutase-like phosphatase (HAD superfamily)